MRTAWRIGKIAGIDIRIDSSWLIIFFLVTLSLAIFYFPGRYPDWHRAQYWFLGILTSLLFFASVLIHELAHSLVANKQKDTVRSITLFVFGGVSQISREPERPGKEFVMAIVGPVSSVGLGILFGILWIVSRGHSTVFSALFQYLSLINFMLALFNLIPGFPLDGGRVLRSIVWGMTGNLRQATRTASIAGQIVAWALILLGVTLAVSGNFVSGLWFAFIGWFLHSAAVRGYQQVVMKEMLQDVKAADLMTTDFETVDPELSVDELVHDHMLKKGRRTFIVQDGGRTVGIVCLEDVKSVSGDERRTKTVKDIMTPESELHTVSPLDDANKVLARLNEEDVHQVPVIDRGQLVGVVCRSDVIRHLQLRSELGI
jgi:Zn-dependent protease/predicted transcriptional regulator